MQRYLLKGLMLYGCRGNASTLHDNRTCALIEEQIPMACASPFSAATLSPNLLPSAGRGIENTPDFAGRGERLSRTAALFFSNC